MSEVEGKNVCSESADERPGGTSGRYVGQGVSGTRIGRQGTILLFLGSFLVYLFTASIEAPFVGDGVVMLEDAVRLLRAPGVGVLSLSSKYGIGQTLLCLPAAPFAILKSGELRPVTTILFALGVACVPAAIAAMTNVLVWLSARDLGYSAKSGFLCAVLFGFTSMSWVYTQSLFSEPATGLFLLASFYCFRRGNAGPSSRFLFWGSAFGAYAFLIKATALLPAGIMMVLAGLERGEDGRRHWLVRGRGRQLLLVLIPWLCALLVAGGYNWVRYQDFLRFGYDAGRDGVFGFNTPLLTGLFGLLVSPGKGVLWYCPTLALALWGLAEFRRRHAREFLMIAGVSLSVLLLHAKWWAWHGDWCWGPRFLVPVLPFVYLFSLPVIEDALSRVGPCCCRFSILRWTVGTLAALALGVQILGLAAPYHRYVIISLFNTPIFRHATYDPQKWPIRDDMVHIHFIPEFSPIAGHAWMLRAIWSRDAESAAVIRSRPPWACLNPAWSPRNGADLADHFRYDVWWLAAWQGRNGLGSAAIGILLSAMLLGLAGAGCLCVNGWLLWRKRVTVPSNAKTSTT